MTDVIQKTYFYQDSQIRDYHLNRPLGKKIWFRTADQFFKMAHDLTDRIASEHPLYEKPARIEDLAKESNPIIPHTFDAGEGILIRAKSCTMRRKGAVPLSSCSLSDVCRTM